MAKPKDEVKNPVYKTEVDFLYEIILKASRSLNELKFFLEDLLTSSEIRMIKRRWHVANLLDEGKSIREVAVEAGVGTDTVERIARRIEEGKGGLAKALEQVRGRRVQARKSLEKKTEDGKIFAKPWAFGTRAR